MGEYECRERERVITKQLWVGWGDWWWCC